MRPLIGRGIAAVLLAAAFAGCASRPSTVFGSIADCDRYASLHPRFAKAFAFLKRPDLSALAPGRYEIDGSNCWATVQEKTLASFETSQAEAHRRYIDIHAPLNGPETIGVLELDDEQLKLPFDEANDYMLFKAESRPVVINPGSFAICFPPRGGHVPGCRAPGGPERGRKVVIKILAD